MKYRTGFYSIILTSIACMLSEAVFAASSVRMLGSNSGTVIGAASDATKGEAVDSGAKSGTLSTSAVSQTNRASSLRFSPSATQSYSGLASSDSGNDTSTSSSIATSPSARLSIGKYLNLSHSNKNTSSSSGSGSSSKDVDSLRTELDRVKDQVDRLKDSKQNVLIVGDGEYIDITGADNNVISIDVEALKSDLQTALGTDRDILTEIDDDYKVWWCYANTAGTACSGERQQVVDLGKLLREHNLATNNNSLREALAGKQGILTPADNGFISINQRAGTIGVKFNELQNALGINDNKTSEIKYENGKLQWRYTDEFENDGVTKKWTEADIRALILANLNNYVQVSVLEDYVTRSELGGLQGALVADEDGYLKIEDNKIDVKFTELKNALNIPEEREVQMQITSDGVLHWRYEGDTTWNDASMNINDLIDAKLVDYATLDDLSGYQGVLSVGNSGFLQLNGNTIDIKFNELRAALNIPSEQSKIEMEVTNAGTLRWRYLDEFLADGVTKKWTEVSINIGDLIDGKLVDYIRREELSDLQGTLTADENGYLKIEDDVIGIKFNELKTALNIPAEQSKIEMEITTGGQLRWRYLDEFVDEEKTIKKWTNVTENINDLIDAKLVSYATLDDISDMQTTLTASDNGYLEINNNQIGVKFTELRNALNIPAERDIEMEITEGGQLRWRYVGVENWTNVSVNIGDLIDGKLAEYVTREEIGGLQGALTADPNGYLRIDDNVIGIKFTELRNALNIPEPQSKIEMEITEAGKLRWRYLDEFAEDGTTKKWTDVSVDIGDLIDGKLANYVDNTSLATTLNNYVTNLGLSTELANYATKTYVDTGLLTKQAVLSEATDGYIAITHVEGGGDTIGIKFNDLRTALNIPNPQAKIEMQVDNGVLQWRYLDEFEADGETKKWTTVSDLKALLEGYVATSTFNEEILRINGELSALDTKIAGKQIKLTPAENGYILLNQETGVIGVDFDSLVTAVNAQLDLDDSDTVTELRVDDGNLQWHYASEGDTWHNLDLSTLNLPYVSETYLTTNYYDKTDIDSLAEDIRNPIDLTLQNLSVPAEGPTDNGLYLLSVSDGANDDKVSTWQTVKIVDGDGVVH